MPKKTVIVGLGGTGDWVLTFLKSRLYAAYGEEEVKKDVQFLLVDTIHTKTREDAFNREDKKFQVKSALDQHEEEVAHLGGVRVESHEYLPLTGEIHDVARSIQRGQDAHTRHLSWFMADYYLRSLPAAAMNITDGAGQWRQFGRIALALSTERGEFTRWIEKLIRSAQLPQGDTLMFYLVSSLAGGTGAGTVLDAAALIRDVANKNKIKVWLVGFLVLPSAFRQVLGDTTMQATTTRSFAAFRELVRFQTQAGQGVPLTIEYSLNHRVEVTDKLFDTVFLLDAQTTWRNLADAPPWSGISPSIADGLEVFIDRSAGSDILQDLINASARMADQVRIDQTLPAQFHSMGSHKIVLPARQYAAIFASRFVVDFLNLVFPTVQEAGIPRLLKTELTGSDYRTHAQEFMRKIPNLFTQIVDLLPTRSPDSNRRIKVFADRSLEEYRGLLRPKAMPQGVDLNFLVKNPLEDIQTGREAGDSAEDAAKRIVRECDRWSNDYWQKLDAVLAAVVGQVKDEISAELQHHTLEILNRKIAELPQHTVGSAQAFLHQIILECDDLSVQVLKAAEKEIDAKLGVRNSLGHWETQLSQAQTAMEATRGLDGMLSRGKAYAAQAAYLKTRTSYLERRKLVRVFEVFQGIAEALRSSAAGLAQQIQSWAEIAVLNNQFSACSEAEGDIADIEGALRRSGESFTSSFGLSAYDRGRQVDITMGGYREVLYERFGRPILGEWLPSVGWDFQVGEPGKPERNGTVHLVLRITEAKSGGLALSVRSGNDLHQSIFDTVKGRLFPQVTRLSIFDYFLDQGHTVDQVADYLKEHTGPLLGHIVPVAGSVPSHQVHLLAQQPPDSRASNFLNALQTRLKIAFTNALFQEGRNLDFDNPYTLTLLYLVQDVREGQLEVMRNYEESYNQQLTINDAYVVNHVFRSEQEAARIEKTYLSEQGLQGAGGWKRLHPRVCRLLDNPARVKLFVQLWALGLIRPEYTADSTTKVWMVLPNGSDPGDAKVVWLTAPPKDSAAERESSLSPVLALEQFCFSGRSARPAGAIPIDYNALERILREKRNSLVDRAAQQPAAELIGTFDGFLKGRLVDEARKWCEEIHSPEEADDLVIVAQHYLRSEVRRLEKNV